MALLQNLGCGLGLCGFANVSFVGLAKIVFKKCAGEKIKIQKRWLLDGRSAGLFFSSLVYVLFCRSLLLCRLFGLQVTCYINSNIYVFYLKLRDNSTFCTCFAFLLWLNLGRVKAYSDVWMVYG